MSRAPAAALVIGEEDRHELLRVIGLRSVPQSVALRVRIVLGASEGHRKTRSWRGGLGDEPPYNLAVARTLPI